MDKKTVLLMIGPPRIGKSTIVNNLPSKFHVLCPDDIRLALGTKFDKKLEGFVWSITNTMARAFMIRGKEFVIDSTSIKESFIKQWKRLADEYNYILKVIVVRGNKDNRIVTYRKLCELNKKDPEGMVPEEVLKERYDQFMELLQQNTIPELVGEENVIYSYDLDEIDEW